MQFNLFASQAVALAPVSLPDADIRYQSDWLLPEQAEDLYLRLQQELPWRQDTIKLYGREVKIPRLQS